MPIKPELRKFYGRKWRKVTRPAILRRAGGVFDDAGRYLGGARCMRCGTPDVYPLSVWTRSVIECAHLDGNSADDSEVNTAALDRTCHRAIDYPVWAAAFRTYLEQERERRIAEKDAARPILVFLEQVSLSSGASGIPTPSEQPPEATRSAGATGQPLATG